MSSKEQKYIIGGGLIATTILSALIFHRSRSKAKGVDNGSPHLAFGFKNWYGQAAMLTDHPRGIRNNNPANLIKTSIPWNGKLANNTDGRFE